MTKEITKAIILQELQDKLKLREFKTAPFLFDETVVPIYDIGSHLGQWSTWYDGRDITSADGQNFFTVPDDELWQLAQYDVVFMSGVYTVAGVYIVRKNKRDAATFIYLDLAAAQSVSYHVELQKTVVLQPGDEININIDGYTSTGTLRLYIDYLVEKIR